MATNKFNLNTLSSMDLYSLILFALYKLGDCPEYATISELAYILDKDSLLKFLKYFGGSTITVPTMRDLKLAAACLLLYQQVNLEGKDFNKAALNLSIKDEYNITEVKKMYFKLCDVLANYSFRRDTNE